MPTQSSQSAGGTGDSENLDDEGSHYSQSTNEVYYNEKGQEVQRFTLDGLDIMIPLPTASSSLASSTVSSAAASSLLLTQPASPDDIHDDSRDDAIDPITEVTTSSEVAPIRGKRK